jgi:hypothetical protein
MSSLAELSSVPEDNACPVWQRKRMTRPSRSMASAPRHWWHRSDITPADHWPNVTFLIPRPLDDLDAYGSTATGTYTQDRKAAPPVVRSVQGTHGPDGTSTS